MDNDDWKALLGQVVVVDTDSMFVYLGTLDRVEDQFLVMTKVDAHDRRESPSTFRIGAFLHLHICGAPGENCRRQHIVKDFVTRHSRPLGRGIDRSQNAHIAVSQSLQDLDDLCFV